MNAYFKENIMLKYWQIAKKMLASSGCLMYSTPKIAVPFINHFERRLGNE